MPGSSFPNARYTLGRANGTSFSRNIALERQLLEHELKLTREERHPSRSACQQESRRTASFEAPTLNELQAGAGSSARRCPPSSGWVKQVGTLPPCLRISLETQATLRGGIPNQPLPGHDTRLLRGRRGTRAIAVSGRVRRRAWRHPRGAHRSARRHGGELRIFDQASTPRRTSRSWLRGMYSDVDRLSSLRNFRYRWGPWRRFGSVRHPQAVLPQRSMTSVSVPGTAFSPRV